MRAPRLIQICVQVVARLLLGVGKSIPKKYSVSKAIRVDQKYNFPHLLANALCQSIQALSFPLCPV